MNRFSRASHLWMVYGSFEMPNLSTDIVDRLDFEQYDGWISANCISNLTIAMMFGSVLTFGDETSSVTPTWTCSYQQQYVMMQIVGKEIFLPAFEYLRHNYKNYNFFHSQMIASPSRVLEAIPLSPKVAETEEVYPKKKQECPVTVDNMIYVSEPYTNDQNCDQSSYRVERGKCKVAFNAPPMKYSGTKKKSNRPLSSIFSSNTVPSSKTYPDSPPVLQLHKEPLAVAYPAYMSCVINTRPRRQCERKLND